MDWHAILEKQAARARRAIDSVPRILDHPHVNADQCSRLLAGITETRFRLDTIQASVNAEGGSASLTSAAGQLGQIWDELSKATTQRLARFGQREAV